MDGSSVSFLLFVSIEHTAQPVLLSDCTLDQVTEIKAKVQYHDVQYATVREQVVHTHKDAAKETDVQLSKHKRQVMGVVSGSCEEALVSCKEEIQAKDRKIKELQQAIIGPQLYWGREHMGRCEWGSTMVTKWQ